MTKEKNPDLEITQEYGVTEAAVLSTLFRHQEKESRLKIGRPISNTRVYIIDDYYRLQPIGVPGELCLAGLGVACGYLNNPVLTAERFINKSFCPEPRAPRRGELMENFSKRVPLAAGGKIYKTGDLARWLEDGNIEFLGRVDTQVKIMGFRIELGESGVL
jgi:non-ribosomal peptide synthetase component F